MIRKIVVERLNGIQAIVPYFSQQSQFIEDPIRGIYIKYVKQLKCGVNYYVQTTKEEYDANF